MIEDGARLEILINSLYSATALPNPLASICLPKSINASNPVRRYDSAEAAFLGSDTLHHLRDPGGSLKDDLFSKL
jgi:hypothetical protein